MTQIAAQLVLFYIRIDENDTKRDEVCRNHGNKSLFEFRTKMSTP